MALLPVLKGTRSYAARTRILTQSITGFVAIKVTRSLSTAVMASQVSVVVFRRRAAVTFPLDRCIAEQGRDPTPRRSVHRPATVGGVGSSAAVLPAKAAALSAVQSRLALKSLLCSEVIGLAAELAGTPETTSYILVIKSYCR